MTEPGQLGWRRVLALVGVGLAAGVLSGLFGIGGGMVVVPALVVILGMDQKRASGTSVVAILPAILAGVYSYFTSGNVAWVPAAALAGGAVVGAQFGGRWLVRLSRRVLQWLFVGFVLVMAVQLVLVVPAREAEVSYGPWQILALVGVGLVAGVLTAVLGIGGGGVVVPVLMAFFGLGDLAARGTSLAMMIPGSISGIIANLRHHNADLRGGLVVGLAAVATSPFGVWLAHLVSPQLGGILFAVFLLVIGAMMAREAVRPEPPR